MSAVFSVFSLATAKQSTHPTKEVDLPEEFAFASGKFVSLIGFKLVPTGLFLPQFWKIVDRLSVDFESLNFMSNGKVKKSSRERFFWGKAWLGDFVSDAVVWEAIILLFFVAGLATLQTFQGFF